MGKTGPMLSLAGLVIGIYLILGAEWLIWDWINSIVNGPWLDRGRFCREWEFPAPFFLYRWRCDEWTAPFDLSKLWLDLGLFLATVSAFVLGYLFRPAIERFFRSGS
jgi:hypothetical protein